ncbi:hypothetical protein FRB99_009030 [Tulasnella sp. 403]|nr:hypothetical protein FRB99_009030 [Tulasnella sp. 403]
MRRVEDTDGVDRKSNCGSGLRRSSGPSVVSFAPAGYVQKAISIQHPSISTLQPTSKDMKVLAVGASRNIGYYASLSLLKEGHTVVFLLRNPSVFESDAEIQSFVTSGHAILIQGDALNEEEVRNAWAQAGNDVELVLFTVGTLSFERKPLKKQPNALLPI